MPRRSTPARSRRSNPTPRFRETREELIDAVRLATQRAVGEEGDDDELDGLLAPAHRGLEAHAQVKVRDKVKIVVD